jgi:hypothetical protein
MDRKRTPVSRDAVTPDRFTRLTRLVELLGKGPQTRATLARRLRVDLRNFYRDLEALRSHGIEVTVMDGRYSLIGEAQEALDRLPFPDPLLSLGEMRQLARGNAEAHRRLRERLEQWAP